LVDAMDALSSRRPAMERAPSTSAMLVLSGANEATMATAVDVRICKTSSGPVETLLWKGASYGNQLRDIHVIFWVSSK
jgi:hypothetical protein